MNHLLLINPPVVCVNEYQRDWYSFAHPTSLLKIASYYRSLGTLVDFIDCMVYEPQWALPHYFYKNQPIGTDNCKCTIATFILGRSLDWFKQQLEVCQKPDEIWVGCHIPFNGELTHTIIAITRERFPRISIVIGGDYPTLFPLDAGKYGTRAFSGRFTNATAEMPDYSCITTPQHYFVFQLSLGCPNQCTHCANHILGPVMPLDMEKVLNDIAQKQKRYGQNTFVNIDPFISSPHLMKFLELIVKNRIEVNMFFYGGIQPNQITRELVQLMKQAHVKGITLPRELSVEQNRKLNKRYTPADFYQAIRLFEQARFDLSDFHCTVPIGFRDESITDIRRTLQEIKTIGAVAELTPVSFVPGTTVFKEHSDLLSGKSLEELNWALWPSLDSMVKIEEYSALYSESHHHHHHHSWHFERVGHQKE